MRPPLALGRLTRRPQFLSVAKGRRATRTSVVIQARACAEAGSTARFGVTATKKVGSSVVRNRAKRRLREAARQLLPQFGHAGVDYVFIARDATAVHPWGRLLDDVKSALLSLGPAAPPDPRASDGRRNEDGGLPSA